MMQRFIRYVVHQRIGRESRRVGLFTASYHVRREGEFFAYELERMGEWLSWFERELTVPPHASIPPQAIFWYADVGRFAEGMWELARIIKDCGLFTELITARFVGKVVYQDPHQFAAIPPRRRHR